MKARNGFYSIIRHVPLPSSNSSEIVGVVLLCSDPDYIGVAFAIQGLHWLGNALERFRNAPADQTNTDLEHTHTETYPAVFQSLTQLKEFLSDLGSEFQISAARRITVLNPTVDIEGILRKSVSTPTRQLCRTPA